MAATPKIEFELAGRGAGWTNVTADVLSSLKIKYGIRGGGPADLTASAGTMTFALNNSERNSASKIGYYSPGHANARTGWAIGIRVRAQFYDAASAAWYVKFIGSVIAIKPTAGSRGRRDVQVIATDWIDEAARARVDGIATQLSKRSDQIISLLVANVPRAPAAQSISTGKATFAYSLDTARDDSANPVLQELARVTLSELGRFYVKGDGTAVFEPRFTRPVTTDLVTLTNSMAGLNVETTRDTLVTRVQMVTHPRTVDTSSVVLYQLKTVTQMNVGATIQILAGYTDPNNRASRVGGTSMVAPVATTDYLANSLADGTGTDLTSGLSIVTNFGGNGVRFDVTNNSGQVAYITKLQARGLGVYDYQNTVAEVSDSALETTYGSQPITMDLPYQNDPAVGYDAASAVLSLYGRATTVGRISIAPATAALQTQILARDIGDRIAIVETVTGVSASYYIQGVDLSVSAPGVVSAEWILTPADTNTYWRIGTAGFSEIGVSTVVMY